MIDKRSSDLLQTVMLTYFSSKGLKDQAIENIVQNNPINKVLSVKASDRFQTLQTIDFIDFTGCVFNPYTLKGISLGEITPREI